MYFPKLLFVTFPNCFQDLVNQVNIKGYNVMRILDALFDDY